MAMNKAEQAVFEKMKQELAFRWPTEECPIKSVGVSDFNDGEVTEWLFNTHTGRVSRYWSTSVTHGQFHDGRKTGGSQGGRNMYTTKREALLAMRWETCHQFAKQLRAIDVQMESEA